MSTSEQTNNPLTATITIPACIEYVRAALDFTQTVAAEQGFSEREQEHIRLAAEETLLYLLETALAGQENTPIHLHFEPQADGLILRILEQGIPLDIQNLPSYSPTRAAEEADSEGLSLHLVRHVMDRMIFTNRGRDGVEVELLKRRSAQHIQSRMAEVAPAQSPSPSAPPAFSIRPALDSEAVEISRCAFLTYGYSYEDYIYYPERIVELNREGILHSLVAVTTEGAVMGHCALKFTPSHPEHAELGVLFVKPEYRKHKLGASLWGATVAKAREMGLESLYARSVTGHQASQKMAVHHGFQDCALLLALFPREVNLKDLGGLQAGKMSGMWQSLQLRTPRTRRLVLPQNHAGIITELYHRAGLPIENPSQQPTGSEEPLLRVQRIPILNVAILEAEAIGKDPRLATQWAISTCRRICREKFDTIYLYINLEQPGAAEVATACAQEGFIFSGIAPSAFPSGDALVLQYLNLPEDPFVQLTVWTETAAMLRDYIQAEWKAMALPSGD